MECIKYKSYTILINNNEVTIFNPDEIRVSKIRYFFSSKSDMLRESKKMISEQVALSRTINVYA
jgi:predicted metal-dependent hydrolase